MTVGPYRRTYRPFRDRRNTNTAYIDHPKFAKHPEHYTRAFLLLQKDIHDLFDYIEPADGNLDCYSFRLHSLLIRAYIEVEANCKAILSENCYPKKPNKFGIKEFRITDYRKINNTHRLSSYTVELPYWNGSSQIRCPFAARSEEKSPEWYDAYNTTKHDRQRGFENASFKNTLDACCGLLVTLSAQFETHDFSPGPQFLQVGPSNTGIGHYFTVRFPTDWPDKMLYDFDWTTIQNEADPFQKLDFDSDPKLAP